jgi:plastocyanin
MRFALALMTLAVAALTLGILALAVPGPAAAADQTVETGNFYFCDPANEGGVCQTSITAGDTITWTIDGAHTVTQCDEGFSNCPSAGGFDSGALNSGDSYQQTFNTPGAYYYRCSFHPNQMMGQIAVAQAATAAPTATQAPATGGGSPTAAPSGLPQTGGFAGSDAGAGAWTYALLALGAVLLAGSAAAFAVARIQRR